MTGVRVMRDVEAIEARGAPDLPSSTYETIVRGASLDWDAPALSFFPTVDHHRAPRTWTYRELVSRINQTANFFHRLGATKDTVIAFVLPNLPETHFVIWGAEATGIVLAVNPMLQESAIAALVEAAGAEIVVTTERRPALRAKHVVLLSELREGAEKERADWLVSGRRFAGADRSSLFATGGTTGKPKLAVRCHRNEVANAWSLGETFGGGLGRGTVFFCGLPLFHVNACLVTGLFPFSRGAHVLLGTSGGYRSPGLVERFWEIVAHHRVSFFSGVPTVYASLLEAASELHDSSSLQYGLCGAAPMPTELFRRFEERTGVPVLEGYGLTEATCVSSANPPAGERRIGSVGLRMPGQRMKTVLLDARGAFVRDCAVDEVGVVVVSGANVFEGYLDATQNEGLFIDCGDGARWLDTGDLARCDADGYFWLTGRRKELIIRGGHNIDPATIEEPLHRHPAVHLAAAVGRPDAHAGEVPVAYVQLKGGASASESELALYLGGEIPERAALPKYVTILDALPLTAVGKVHKLALRRRAAHDAVASALVAAGVTFRSVDVVDDATRGLAAKVELASAGSAAIARDVLGRLTAPFTLSWPEP